MKKTNYRLYYENEQKRIKRTKKALTHIINYVVMIALIVICGSGAQFFYALINGEALLITVGGWIGGALGLALFNLYAQATKEKITNE